MKLPLIPAITKVLTDLIGRAVVVRACTPSASPSARESVAAYVDEAGTLKAVSYCDIAVGGSLGAALVMVPPAVVDDCTKAGALNADLQENLHEIFNVLASVFPQTGSPRLILSTTATGAAIAADLRSFMGASKQRLDLEVAVSGYRTGRLSLLI